MANVIIPEFKIVLIGDYSVGKKSIMCSFSGQEFNETQLVKCNVRSRIIELDETKIKLHIWHAWLLALAAGGHQYINMKKNYYNKTHGIMLVYDTTNEESFENLEYWMNQIKNNAPKYVEIILIGSKCDLKRSREVTKEKGEQFAKKYGIKFFEVSAKLNINTEKVLYTFTRDIYTKMKDELDITNNLHNDCIIPVDSSDQPDKSEAKTGCTVV